MTAIPSKPNPKARLIELGAKALTDGELLAVVLRLRSRTDRCDEVLAESLGLSGLLTDRFPSVKLRTAHSCPVTH